MSTYVVCQQWHEGYWAVCVYTVNRCDRIVQGPPGEGGVVECGGKLDRFKMAIFADDNNFLHAVNQVEDWCSEDNEAKEAKDGATATE